MFDGRKKIYKAILQTERNYPKDISYRGQGLSNEYRPILPRGLVGHYEKRHVKKLLNIYKNKYKLKTLDQACINNSVACLRRIPNTQYISKITGEPTGVWCVQLTVNEVMKMSIEELYGMAMGPRTEEFESTKSKKAYRHFVEYMCDSLEIKHTVSLSIQHLLDKINNK
ncbi:MAG: hypothetical protein CM15mV52_0210 [uncultured marine virus]|nr:MAG: hypothetical protein CM15mV52_0210 [uncultured marine virus]